MIHFYLQLVTLSHLHLTCHNNNMVMSIHSNVYYMEMTKLLDYSTWYLFGQISLHYNSDTKLRLRLRLKHRRCTHFDKCSVEIGCVFEAYLTTLELRSRIITAVKISLFLRNATLIPCRRLYVFEDNVNI